MSGLLRGVARTAMVAGTATAVSNRVSRQQGQRWAMQDAQYASDEQYAAPQPVSAPPSGGGAAMDRIAALKELAELEAQGVLTDAEFEAEKGRILGSRDAGRKPVQPSPPIPASVVRRRSLSVAVHPGGARIALHASAMSTT